MDRGFQPYHPPREPPGPGTVNGQVRAKLQTTEDPASLALKGNWNVPSRPLWAGKALGRFGVP